MNHYLVSRVDGAPSVDCPIEQFPGLMFFQLWAVRADPFNVLKDGDTLWWADQRTREVRWQMRVRNVRRSQCASIDSAREYLRRWFGVYPGDLSDYRSDGSFSNGWLLAWENEVVAPVSARLPTGFKLGRNGFRRLDDQALRVIGLRPSRKAPIRPVEPLADQDLLAAPRERAIPTHIAQAVWQRDGRICRSCKSPSGPFHLDHVYPWSKGGPNSLENLQVLCAACNLRKAARVTSKLRPTVPALEQLVDAAARLQRPVPSSPHELQQFLGILSKDLDEAGMINLALAIAFHPAASDELCSAVITGLSTTDQRLQTWATVIEALVNGNSSERVSELTKLNDELGKAASACHVSYGSLAKRERLRLGRKAALASHPYIAAHGHYALAEFVDDDREAVAQMKLAFERGDHAVACLAALRLGEWLADHGAAIEYLLFAARANNIGLAATATALLAEHFPEDPAIADYYRARAAQFTLN